MSTELDALLEAIARSELGITTLAIRGRDQLDFHEVGVAALKRALHRAYMAGADATAARIFRITPQEREPHEPL